MPDGSSVQAYQYQTVSVRVVFQAQLHLLHFNVDMIRRLDDVTAQLAALQKTLEKQSPVSNPQSAPATSSLSEDTILTEAQEVQLGQLVVEEKFYRTSLPNDLPTPPASLGDTTLTHDQVIGLFEQ